MKDISMKEIPENTEDKKIIYVSHPFGNKKENVKNIEYIIRHEQKSFPKYIFFSPVHCFGFLYEDVSYQEGLNMCLTMLDKCDEMWVFGDIRNSVGCQAEVQYCKEHKIPYLLKENKE